MHQYLANRCTLPLPLPPISSSPTFLLHSYYVFILLLLHSSTTFSSSSSSLLLPPHLPPLFSSSTSFLFLLLVLPPAWLYCFSLYIFGFLCLIYFLSHYTSWSFLPSTIQDHYFHWLLLTSLRFRLVFSPRFFSCPFLSFSLFLLLSVVIHFPLSMMILFYLLPSLSLSSSVTLFTALSLLLSFTLCFSCASSALLFSHYFHSFLLTFLIFSPELYTAANYSFSSLLLSILFFLSIPYISTTCPSLPSPRARVLRAA